MWDLKKSIYTREWQASECQTERAGQFSYLRLKDWPTTSAFISCCPRQRNEDSKDTRQSIQTILHIITQSCTQESMATYIYFLIIRTERGWRELLEDSICSTGWVESTAMSRWLVSNVGPKKLNKWADVWIIVFYLREMLLIWLRASYLYQQTTQIHTLFVFFTQKTPTHNSN